MGRKMAPQGHHRPRLAPLRQLQDVEVHRQHRPHGNHPRRLRHPLPTNARHPLSKLRHLDRSAAKWRDPCISLTPSPICHPERSSWRLFARCAVEGPRSTRPRHDCRDLFNQESHPGRARPLRLRRPPLLPPPRDPLRPGRQLQLRRPHHPLQRRPRQRLRQPSQSHTVDDRQVLLRSGSGVRIRKKQGPLPAI